QFATPSASGPTSAAASPSSTARPSTSSFSTARTACRPRCASPRAPSPPPSSPPREVFSPAIRNGAAALVLVHNHPSGDPTPSAEDIALTERLRQVGDLVGVRILDHVVIGRARWVSMAETGNW